MKSRLYNTLHKFKWVVPISIGILLVLSYAIPVLAATSNPTTPIANLNTGMTALGSTYGVSPEPYTNTFYAEGKHWLFYLDRGKQPREFDEALKKLGVK
jgi:hypothetical protein